MKYPKLIAAALALTVLQGAGMAAEVTELNTIGINARLEAMIDGRIAASLSREPDRSPATAGNSGIVDHAAPVATSRDRHGARGRTTEFQGLYPAL